MDRGRAWLAGLTAALLLGSAAQAQDPVKIGFVVELTGPWAFFGTSCVAGLKLAEAQLNPPGKRKIEFVTINNQTWIGTAPSMPIYRDQYFSAATNNSIPGALNPSLLTITCSPSCPQNPSGSFDGFFTGRSGQRAGMMYNMGGVAGAVAFGRRGG